MKWSFASVGLIMLGLFGILVIMLFNDITVSNEQDYYNLKDVTEAAMIDAIDIAYYRLTGEFKISEQKFVENFTRRFTQVSTFGSGNYEIEFYQIVEYPAKVSVKIVDKTSTYNIYTYSADVDATQATMVNQLSAILDNKKNQTNGNQANTPRVQSSNTNSSLTTEEASSASPEPSKSNAKTYKITYHANYTGGGADWSEKVEYGSEYTTWKNWYTRQGYEFTGWNESANGKGANWTSWIGKAWTWDYTKDVNLYAQWKFVGYCCVTNSNKYYYSDYGCDAKNDGAKFWRNAKDVSDKNKKCD